MSNAMLGIASVFSSAIYHILNPASCNITPRKTEAPPATIESHPRTDIAEAQHARDLACRSFVKLCDGTIGGGFNGASPGLARAFQTALSPKRYGALKELRNTTVMKRRTRPSKCQVKSFTTKCEFIGRLYNYGIRSEIVVWSFLNDLLRDRSDDSQVRYGYALWTSAEPKLPNAFSTTSAMSLETKHMIDVLKQTRLTDRTYGSSDNAAEERLVKLIVDLKLSAFATSGDNLQVTLKITDKPCPDEFSDIKRGQTSSLISSLNLDQVSQVITINHAAFADGTEQVLNVAGVLLAGLVNAGHITKYSVVKGFFILHKDENINEQYPSLPGMVTTIRNEFENRLSKEPPLIDLLYGVNRTFQLADSNLHTAMVNVEFLELLFKFKTKFKPNERHELMRLLKPVISATLNQSHVHVVSSVIYTALYNEGKDLSINAGKLLAKLVSSKQLRKISITTGFYKILTDDDANEYFTNVPELLETIRTAYENELYNP